VLGVHRSLFYYHRAQSKKPDITREALRRRVAELHQISRCSAGARTLSRLLRNEGKDVGRYKASQLMKEAGLASKQPGKHSYRVREHVSCLAGNNLDRCFRVDAPNKVWCGDITFIRTKAGWL
jgi:putative transposase